jgi:hypothetical protein
MGGGGRGAAWASLTILVLFGSILHFFDGGGRGVEQHGPLLLF